MSERARRLLGDLARMCAATVLGCCSLVVWVHHVGGPAPVWSRVACAAVAGVALAVVAELWSPLA